MPDVSSHPAGAFSWVELATTDPKAAVAFYRSVIGWNVVEHDMGPNGVYTIFTIRDRDVAAAAGQHPQERDMKIPPHWNLYVTVEDADAAAKKVEALGGKVEAPAFDVMNHGRMAVIQDPTGAMFNLWQPKEHIGVKINNEPGALCWSELTTRDPKKAEAFYTGMFGWSIKQSGAGTPAEYREFSVGGQPIGGIMLPWFVRQDFDDVLEELGRSGYALDAEWFAPHFEFRFPLYGEVTVRGTHLMLRQALEPWHVLGEEGSAGGSVRFVDSSVERLELQVTGLTPDRYVLTCNGRTVPLHPTGRNGEYVAGVRYRAWQPASALHPTIPVHAPLTFDIVDTWLERSLGGCGYHVMHPGGRNYDHFPVNSYEAESRRLTRFSRIAHTPGRVRVAPAAPSREFPYTLDLRTPA